MKNLVCSSLLLLALVSTSHAQSIGWQPVTSGGSSASAIKERGSNQGYQGSSGARYQYDLSKPTDQLRYEIDPGAQLRDQISVDPGRDLDRSIGQHGGGYLGR